MSIQRCSHIAVYFAVVLASSFVGEAKSADDTTLRRLAEVVKPTVEELRWRQIPWELDPEAALKLARAEKRPIFFWAAGGRQRDGLPLERC